MELYQKVKLLTGEYAHIVEIYENGVAYEADIYSKNDGKTRTDTIKHSEIVSLIIEVEKPIAEVR
ncbi:MAG: hypothetical protein FWG63_12095 [Defluviitaleaceae bacterium]|nr:hypothetical protein [Defluviitaleaceae bacterium]